MRTCPAAYCPPGSFCGLLSIPRALPPVTHGSALQAPECLWRSGDMITFQKPECMWFLFSATDRTDWTELPLEPLNP